MKKLWGKGKFIVLLSLLILVGCTTPPPQKINPAKLDQALAEEEMPVYLRAVTETQNDVTLKIERKRFGEVGIESVGSPSVYPVEMTVTNNSKDPIVIDPSNFSILFFEKDFKAMTEGEIIIALNEEYRKKQERKIRNGTLDGAAGGALLGLALNQIWGGYGTGRSVATGAITGGVAGTANEQYQKNAAKQSIDPLVEYRVKDKPLKIISCSPGATQKGLIFFPREIHFLKATINNLTFMLNFKVEQKII